MKLERMDSAQSQDRLGKLAPVLLRLALCAFVVSVATTAGAQPASPRLETIDLPAELERVLTDYEDAWRAADAEALTQLFVADGFVSGRSGWLRGHEAIRAKYTKSGGDLRLRGIEYAIEGGTGFIVGAYGYGDEAATRDQGLFVLVLARPDDGSAWRIVADLDRSAD